MLDETDLGRSLMQIKNRGESSRPPLGTTEVTLVVGKVSPFVTLYWSRLDKNSDIQSIRDGLVLSALVWLLIFYEVPYQRPLRSL